MSDTKPFTAGDGYTALGIGLDWKVTKITGKTVSANEETIVTFSAEKKKKLKPNQMFPMELKKLIGCHTKQVFSFSEIETRLFWKKMPNRTYIHRGAKEKLEHKTWRLQSPIIIFYQKVLA